MESLYLIIEIGQGPFKVICEDCNIMFVTESKAWATRKRNMYEAMCATGMADGHLFKYYILEINK